MVGTWKQFHVVCNNGFIVNIVQEFVLFWFWSIPQARQSFTNLYFPIRLVMILCNSGGFQLVKLTQVDTVFELILSNYQL